MKTVDLRSDTVTRPSRAMREAMAGAAVGDDVYGEDPSVRELEEYTADLLGKPRALFVPSGTMANQLALLTQTRPGNEVVVGHGAHIAWHEAGAGAAWAGVQFAVAGQHGVFDAGDLDSVLKPASPQAPRCALVCLENTHNLSGGRVFPRADIAEIHRLARSRGLPLHLDGARLWHACEVNGETPAAAAEPFDSVSVCFSKGLGAPVGSALVASPDLIAEAWRFRKMLGGGMRQSGILAAGALYALRHHLSELALDHEKARVASEILKAAGADVTDPQTNILLLHVPRRAVRVAELAREAGVLVHAMARDVIRLVAHRDVNLDEVRLAAIRLGGCLDAATEPPEE